MLLSEKSLPFVGLLLLFELMFILEIVTFGKWSLVYYQLSILYWEDYLLVSKTVPLDHTESFAEPEVD